MKTPVCDQNVKSITKFLSSFYMLGQDAGDQWCCTCPEYGKTLQCKHSLAIAIEEGMEIPAMFNQAKIGGTKRQPGRPRKRPLDGASDGDDGAFD